MVPVFFYVMMTQDGNWQGFWSRASDLKKLKNERKTGADRQGHPGAAQPGNTSNSNTGETGDENGMDEAVKDPTSQPKKNSGISRIKT